MRAITKTFMAVMPVAVMALVVPGANADLVLWMDDPATAGTDVIIADGLPALSTTASGLITTVGDGTRDGVLSYSGAFGSWVVAVATGLSDPVVGPPAQIDLSSVDATSAAGGSLVVALTDTDFGPLALPSALQSAIGGVVNMSGGTLSSTWAADEGNGEFIGGTAISGFGPFGPGAFSASANAPLSIPLSPLFSLSNSVSISHPGAGSTSFNSTVAVPAPGAVLLGAIGLGTVGWMKRRFS